MGVPLKATVNFNLWNKRLVEIQHLLGPESMGDLLDFVGDRLGILAQQIVTSEYPPPQRKRGEAPSPLRTARQWRWWWAMMNRLADGKSVPEGLHGWKAVRGVMNGRPHLFLSGSYFRTGTLVRGITYAVGKTGEGRDIEVGPNQSAALYAKYVIGRPPQQARYHQGNWTPLVDLLTSRSAAFQQAAQAAVEEWTDREMKRRGLV